MKKSIEASTLGLPIGHWPNLLTFENKIYKLLSLKKDEEDEITHAIYERTIQGTTEFLTVWND